MSDWVILNLFIFNFVSGFKSISYYNEPESDSPLEIVKGKKLTKRTKCSIRLHFMLILTLTETVGRIVFCIIIFNFQAKLFRTIAQKLGFPYVIGPPISKKRWSGLGADISANLTDVGWADIFLRPSLSKEYTTMYDQDGACFLVLITCDKSTDKNNLLN